MDLGLAGKRAVVTGGSLGIGKAIAHELAHETGRRILPLAADVSSRAQVDGVMAQAAAQVEALDYAPDSPRGNAICRMVDASEIAYATVFLAPTRRRRSPASSSSSVSQAAPVTTSSPRRQRQSVDRRAGAGVVYAGWGSAAATVFSSTHGSRGLRRV